MNFIFPILAATLQAGSSVVDKFTLSIKRIGPKEYLGASFPLIFLITLVIFFIFRPPLTADLFSNSLLLLLFASAALSIGGNLFYYHALDHDNLSEVVVFNLLANIPVIILSSLIFADERNFTVIIPALVASSAVIWSHWEHHHFKILKDTKHYVVWVMLAVPVGASISKQLLTVWSPIALELFRSGIMAIILGYLFFSNIHKIPKRGWPFLILTNLLTTVAWILFYYSYKISGVVYTALIFSLEPLLVYFASLLILKEKLHWKKAAAFIVVLISIIVAQIIK